jgi:hypothetical protein
MAWQLELSLLLLVATSLSPMIMRVREPSNSILAMAGGHRVTSEWGCLLSCHLECLCRRRVATNSFHLYAGELLATGELKGHSFAVTSAPLARTWGVEGPQRSRMRFEALG